MVTGGPEGPRTLTWKFEKPPRSVQLPLLSPSKCLSSGYRQRPCRVFSSCCVTGAECGRRLRLRVRLGVSLTAP